MPDTNGHAAPEGAATAELDALLVGLFEPTYYTLAPGRTLEIRPLMLDQADALYAGGLAGAGLQRYLLARCVYVNGLPIGEEGAARLPVILANKLAPVVMQANGMAGELEGGDQQAGPPDPL